jgi:hypothetical protein
LGAVEEEPELASRAPEAGAWESLKRVNSDLLASSFRARAAAVSNVNFESLLSGAEVRPESGRVLLLALEGVGPTGREVPEL